MQLLGSWPTLRFTVSETRSLLVVVWLLSLDCQVMSNSLRLHRLQHSSLPCPSPSPRGCPSSCPLNQILKPKTSFCCQNYGISIRIWCVLNRSVISNSNLPGSSVHGDSPGKSTRVGCYTLLQGIFPTQGSNPGLPHSRQILYCLSHQETQVSKQ